MVSKEDLAPLDEVVEYMRKSEWQFKMLAPDHRITVNARILFSVYHYLATVEKVLREQQTEGREHPRLPPTA